MAEKQTAGHDRLGDFAPNSRTTTTMYSSGRSGPAKMRFPHMTAA